MTNAQFDAFVQAQGYVKESYWREAMQAGYWTPDGFKGRWDNERRQQPYDFGEPYRLPNHPVVGVTWYEALAYTRWLTEVGQAWLPAGWRVQLPSEPEWEKAARGGEGLPARPIVRPFHALGPAALDPGPSTLDPASATLDLRRRYPWGDNRDPNCANCRESGIGTTSAVGCFEGGASRYGAEEMSGNVWEWTRSLWGSDRQKARYGYPYAAADGRENLAADANELRIVRGGAWHVDIMRVRCAQRVRLNPDYWDNISGFRVVVSP